MTFEEIKHLEKPSPRVIHTQECYQPIYNQGIYVTSIKIKPGVTYTNPGKEISTRRIRTVKHFNN